MRSSSQSTGIGRTTGVKYLATIPTACFALCRQRSDLSIGWTGTFAAPRVVRTTFYGSILLRLTIDELAGGFRGQRRAWCISIGAVREMN